MLPPWNTSVDAEPSWAKLPNYMSSVGCMHSESPSLRKAEGNSFLSRQLDAKAFLKEQAKAKLRVITKRQVAKEVSEG